MTQSLPTSNPGKVSHFPGKIFKVLQGQPITPLLLEVHPSQACNFFCPHCVGRDAGKRQGRSLLSFQDFKEKIHDPYLQLQWEGEECKKRFSFSGETGDPLACQDFFRMLEYCQLPFIVITNGYGKIDPILLQADGIRISLDTVDPDSFGRMHGLVDGQKALDRVLKNVANLLDWKKQQGATTSIGFGCLTGRQTTAEEIHSAIRVAEDVGVEYINFRPLHGDDNNLSAVRRAVATASHTTNVLFSDKYKQMENDPDGGQAQDVCYATAFLMVVASDLQVYTCCHFTGREEFAAGSLKDTSLEEILQNNIIHNQKFPNAHCPAWCRGHRINADITAIAHPARFDPYL